MAAIAALFRKAWIQDPAVCVAVALGVSSIPLFVFGPYTKKSDEEMENWPSMHNFYNLPTQKSLIYETIPQRKQDIPRWAPPSYDN